MLGCIARSRSRAYSVLGGISEDLLISTSIGHQIGGTSHQNLINSLVKTNVIESNSRLERAMRAVDRAHFVPTDLRLTPTPSVVYQNRPIKIDVVATISTPQQHAQVLGLLNEHLYPGARALDIGAGSGYLVAVMAHLVGATGSVTGVELVPELIAFAKENLKSSLDKELLPRTSIVASTNKHVLQLFTTGTLSNPIPEVLFDCIHVGVAVESKQEAEAFLPFLKPGGGLLVPLGRGGEEQKLVKMTKYENGDVTKHDIMSVLCQPILDKIPVQSIIPIETRTERIARLENELKQWRSEFEVLHHRRPTRDDMMRDPIAKQLFTDYTAIKK